MKAILAGVQYVVLIALLGGIGYVLYPQAKTYLTPPCSVPVAYSIGSIDPLYGVSTSTLEAVLAKAATAWNVAAGKTVVTFTASGGVPVHLVYTAVAQTAVLGKTIDADQKVYNAAKANLQALKSEFDAEKRAYQSALDAFNAESKAYSDEVAMWNERGGAPPAAFRELQSKKQSLEAEQAQLNARVAGINALVSRINEGVTALNAAAKKINAKVNTYNAALGNDFDQGDYVSDAKGKRINIFEFTSTTDLTRVLEHELGHAIGLEHVENPASIMYAYNLGSGLALSDEDIAELDTVCKIKP